MAPRQLLHLPPRPLPVDLPPTQGHPIGVHPRHLFREHDQAWQDEVDYEAVSVNVDPDDIPRLREKIDAMMWHESSMADMREAIRGIKVGAGLGKGGGR